MATDFSVLFNANTNQFEFTDTSAWATPANMLGANIKVTSPSGTVLHNNTSYAVVTGTATAGAASSITLTGTSSTDDFYKGYFVVITSGTGSGQARYISAYSGTTKVATIYNLWTTAPDNTSVYKIYLADIAINATWTPETNTSQGYTTSTRNTITLASAASSVNSFYNGLYIKITSGTGAGQTRLVSSYVGSTRVATLSTDWTTLPDTTSVYQLNYSEFFNSAINILQSANAVSIPVLSDGTIEPGQYTFEYTAQDNVGAYYTTTKTFNYGVTYPAMTISSTVDCVTPQVTGTDVTNYTTGTYTPSTIDRTNILFYPVIGNTQLSSVVTASASASTTTVYNRNYDSFISSNLTYSYGSGIYSYVTIDNSQCIVVNCPSALCDVFCCLNTVYNNWLTNIPLNSTLANQYLNQFIQASEVSNLLGMAVRCNQSSLVDGYVNTILKITNCTLGCGCSDGEAQLITGLGTVSQTASVLSGNGITVTANTTGNNTAYTVSLSNALLTQINALTANAVTSVTGTGPITVTNPSTGVFNVQGATITATDSSIIITPTGSPVTSYALQAIPKNVLVDDFTASPTTSATTYQSKKPITIATTDLVTNGDKMVITEFITGDLGVTNKIKTLLDSGTNLYGDFAFKNLAAVKLVWNIVRLSNTSIEILLEAYMYSPNYQLVSPTATTPINKTVFLSGNPYTVTSLIGGTHTFDTQMYSTNSGGMVYKYQQVDIFKK